MKVVWGFIIHIWLGDRKYQKKSVSPRKVWAETIARRCIGRWVTTTSGHLQSSLMIPACRNLTNWLCGSNMSHYTLNECIDIYLTYRVTGESGSKSTQMYANIATPISTTLTFKRLPMAIKCQGEIRRIFFSAVLVNVICNESNIDSASITALWKKK